MTLLAHWKLDDGAADEPTTAVDDAAGGSGSHDGTYTLSSSVYGGFLDSGGVGGKHLLCMGSSSGYVSSIGNPSDLRLLGLLTVMFWYHPDDYYWNYYKKVVNCTGTEDSTAAQNDPWDIRVYSLTVQLRWETAPGTRVTVTSGNILPGNGWSHIAVVRYEVTAGMYGVKFYVNGVLADTQDNSGAGWAPPVDGSSALTYIGRDGYANNTTEFRIDSVRIYDSEESDANILAVYTAEEPYAATTGVDMEPIDEPIEDLVSRYIKIDTGPNSPRSGAGFTFV